MKVRTQIEAMKAARDMLSKAGDNIAKPQDSSGIDSKLVNRASSAGILGIDSVLVRREDRFLTDIVRSNVTKAAFASEIHDSLDALQSVLEDVPKDDKSKDILPASVLVSEIDSFISSMSFLAEKDQAKQQMFLSQAIKLAESFSGVGKKINNLRLNADQNLQTSIMEANNLIREIHALNVSISKGRDLSLLDNRDKLLNNLSKYFEIKVSIGKDGEAFVSSAVNGSAIISQHGYGQLNYNSCFSEQSILDKKPNNPIMLDWFNSKGTRLDTVTVIDNDSQKINGGKIDAYIKLRDKLLVESWDAVQSLNEALSSSINKIHNDGSPFPPKTKFQSKELSRLRDVVNWQGKIDIAVVSDKGESIDGSSGAIRPVTIDLGKLSGSLGSGALKISEIIKEINAFLNSGIATNRLSIGEIRDNTNAPIANQYLVNDVKLVGKSDIQNGNFTFDLELDGSQFFGSKVEILKVTGPGGDIPTNHLPPSFILEKGIHTRTNQAITVSNIAGPALQNIDIELRVIGDNGVVSQGTARFVVNPAQPRMMNERVLGIPQGPGLVAGNITHPPIISAKLVDVNGVKIDDNDFETKGHLVIETTDSSIGLVIDSKNSNEISSNKGFGYHFGFNNFFEWDKLSGKIAVNEEIANNINKLSIGKLSNGGETKLVRIGYEASKATMQFTGGNPANGNTVTINGKVFTFRNPMIAGALDTDIDASVDLPTTLTNLVNAINNDQTLLVSAVSNGVDTLTVTAKNPGSSGDNISVQASVPTNINNIPILANTSTQLNGGTDQTEEIIVFSSKLGNASAQNLSGFMDYSKIMLHDIGGTSLVPIVSTTLHGFASIVNSGISGQFSDAKADAEVAEKVLDMADTKLKNAVGINREDEYNKAKEFLDYYQANVAVSKLIQKMFDSLINIFH